MVTFEQQEASIITTLEQVEKAKEFEMNIM